MDSPLLATDLHHDLVVVGFKRHPWLATGAMAPIFLFALCAAGEKVVTFSPRIPLRGATKPEITSIEVGRAVVSKSRLLPLPPRYKPKLRTLKENPKLYLHDLATVPLRMRPVQSLIRKLLKNNRTERDMDARQVLEHLEPGRRYSYVITEDAVIFAPIKGHPALSILSKHYVLADGRPGSVLGPGEMWAQDGKLFVDNNSGTFKPTAAELERTVSFFRNQLGLKNVVAKPRGAE